MQKVELLLTNDDGIDAPGLKTLAEALVDIANITIVAPAVQQSSKSLSHTYSGTLEVSPVDFMEGVKAWKVHGTPTDCVRFALSHVVSNHPDLLLSGMNFGCNSGRSLLYSGTVGAAIHATFSGVPSIAFSVRHNVTIDFEKTKDFLPLLVTHFLSHRPPMGTLINVNFPVHPREQILGIRFAKQGLGHWNTNLKKEKDHNAMPCFVFEDGWASYEEEKESDIFLLEEGYITAVPVQVSDLTNYEHRKTHQNIFEKLNEHPVFQK